MKATTNPGCTVTQSVHDISKLSVMYVYSKHYISSYTCGRVGFVDVCGRILGREDMLTRGSIYTGQGCSFWRRIAKNG